MCLELIGKQATKASHTHACACTQELILAYEDGRELVISKQEWPEFVHALATSDLHVKEHIRESSVEQEGL